MWRRPYEWASATYLSRSKALWMSRVTLESHLNRLWIVEGKRPTKSVWPISWPPPRIFRHPSACMLWRRRRRRTRESGKHTNSRKSALQSLSIVNWDSWEFLPAHSASRHTRTNKQENLESRLDTRFIWRWPCAVCCSVLQCVAACCSVLQCAAVCRNVLQCVAACCSVLRCVAVCCSVAQCVAVGCSALRCDAVWCSVLQCGAVRCSGVQCVEVCCVLQCGAVWCIAVQCGAVRCSAVQRVAVRVCYGCGGRGARKNLVDILKSQLLQCVTACCSV